MSDRELRSLGISLPGETTETTKVETTAVDTTIESTKMATIATQVNPSHDVVDLSSLEGKKLCQNATEGLPND